MITTDITTAGTNASDAVDDSAITEGTDETPATVLSDFDADGNNLEG